MKLIYLVISAIILSATAFYYLQTDDIDYAGIENLINQNSIELLKSDKTSNKAEDKKRSLEIATQIQSGECPDTIDEKLKSYSIKNLASKDLTENEAKLIIDCIQTLGIKQENHYTLMVDLMAFWDKDNALLEQFYTTFFKGYKSPNSAILGLLDNAKLMCMNAAINYLKQQDYPENYNNLMTKKEYNLLMEYINEYRCSR